MGQPLFEYEAKFIKALKQNTGNDLQEWLSIIETSNLEERHAIRDWLQNECGLDYMAAHKLSHLHREDQRLNGPKISFSGTLRSGNVEYTNKEYSLIMEWEMGAHNVLAIINVPSVERWGTETNIPLAKRESVLHFIGRKTVELQTKGSGAYKIQDNCIIIKSSKSWDIF